MWKLLFKPIYSVFEFVTIAYTMLLMYTYSFWFILLIPIGVIMQVTMTNRILKQKSIEEEINQ